MSLTDDQAYFLNALDKAGGKFVKPPALRDQPREQYRRDDRARQQCRKLGYAEPVKSGSPFWNLTQLGREALSA